MVSVDSVKSYPVIVGVEYRYESTFTVCKNLLNKFCLAKFENKVTRFGFIFGVEISVKVTYNMLNKTAGR